MIKTVIEYIRCKFGSKPIPTFFINRGVAKVVSRQFRVLETVGSSPAASTKRPFLTVFFYFVEADKDENPPRAS